MPDDARTGILYESPARLEPLCEDWGHYDDTLVRVAYPAIAGALKERSIALVSDEIPISRSGGRETERER